jgi:DNA-directed RNA polymerase subunit alpha
MEKISLPQKISFQAGERENEGIVVIEPCYPGYGTTIGNALRRVLLSSLPGAAVVGIKIKGVSHEFSTLPNVKEDILKIILNLKQLRLKVLSDLDEEIVLELKAHGEKQVTANDIAKNPSIEIANKDLLIANITDMAGSLEMEIFVKQGRGYRPVEAIEEKRNEIGYIEMDSIFSPILSVGVKVDNVRVGKMTNWDKLFLNILTDGTISAEEAFKQSVDILIPQFGALIAEKKEEVVVEEKAEEVSKPVEKEKEAEKPSDEEVKESSPKKRGRPKKSE